MFQLMQESNVTTESPYGPPVEADQAPEVISKTVASLPPEQMFQLMQQMKMCIQNNPQEARVMLAQNPQLAYALLQAQVVMRIIDPETAVEMLHKAAPQVPPLGVTPTSQQAPSHPQHNRPPPLMPPSSGRIDMRSFPRGGSADRDGNFG